MINNHLCLWAGSFFIPQDSETFEHSSWPCPVAPGTFESQVHAHFWGGEVELWRHELAFPTSYGTKSPRVRFSASQPKEAFFRSLASFTWLFWYNVTRQTSKKFYCPARLWLWIQVGKELATRNRDLPKGAGEQQSRRECGSDQCPLLEGSRQTLDTSAVLVHGPLKHQTGEIHPPAPECSDCRLRCCVTQLANNRLRIRLAQLRPIPGSEHMAQTVPPPPMTVHRSCCFHSASLRQFEMPRTMLKQVKTASHKHGCQVDYQQREESIHWIILKEWNGIQMV